LRQIIENAERVERYLAGMDKPAFEQSEWADELMPDQPWGDIRGMGNRLRHAYERVDVTIVWNTARLRLPELAAAARQAIAQLSD
jgi:uncharacterized protein with HEPN domain